MRRQQTPGRGRYAQLTAALVCLLGLGNFVTSQQDISASDSQESLRRACGTNNAQVTVVGDKMYLDGGEIYDEQEFWLGKDKPFRITAMTPWQSECSSINPLEFLILHTSFAFALLILSPYIFSDSDLWELDLSQKFNVSIPPWTAHAKPTDWNQYYDARSGTIWNIGDGKFYTVGGFISGWQGPPPGYRITEPYYKHNTAGYYFQLPQPRIFTYDPQAGSWSTELVLTHVRRVAENAYTQSARNRVGYSFGGFLVAEAEASSEEFYTQGKEGEALDQFSAYDFETKKINFTSMPVDIGKTHLVLVHSLDRVGSEGTLVAFAGISDNDTDDKFVSLFFFAFLYSYARL